MSSLIGTCPRGSYAWCLIALPIVSRGGHWTKTRIVLFSRQMRWCHRCFEVFFWRKLALMLPSNAANYVVF